MKIPLWKYCECGARMNKFTIEGVVKYRCKNLNHDKVMRRVAMGRGGKSAGRSGNAKNFRK